MGGGIVSISASKKLSTFCPLISKEDFEMRTSKNSTTASTRRISDVPTPLIVYSVGMRVNSARMAGMITMHSQTSRDTGCGFWILCM